MSLPPNPDSVLNVPVSPELVEKHGLTADEYERIIAILGRAPSLTELGIFSVMWSEHCSYKNSRPLLKLFPVTRTDEEAPYQILVKAGEENAGVVDIGDGYAVCFKIESHNHPTAVEPFEGAATGVGGIIRDIFTMGARPALLTNSLRFGDLNTAEARRLFRGAVHGISHYGNCIGIPNVGGDVYFDACYDGNPLVNALCLGTLRHDQIKRGAATGVGNPVFYVGAPTGRDGLGGASFASRELSAESAVDRPAVQKGDPFMEKLLMEACLEMMARPGLVVGIQDMGAAGLTCSTCETAARGGTGVEIELDRVPQREAGMNSYEILLSESQERMLVIVQKGREDELLEIFDKWDLPAAQVGEVVEGGAMRVLQGGVVVAEIPARPLADEAPVYERKAVRPASMDASQAWRPEALATPSADALEGALPALLGHPSIASKQWVYRQYDHMVMAGTVVLPGSDAAVVRIRMDNGKFKYIAIANDCNHIHCSLNPRRGGMGAVAECIRNLACSGARPLAMTNNLNFGNPHKPESFYMLSECVKGLAEACRTFELPVVGGNVSLYNEKESSRIDPTPVVSVVGLIENTQSIIRQFLTSGDASLILLGDLPDELGGSHYLQQVHGLKTGDAPAVDLNKEANLVEFILGQIDKHRVLAAHDLSEGGLLVAAAEMLFGETTGLGMQLDLSDFKPARADTALYGESHGRALLAVPPAQTHRVLRDAERYNISADHIGDANTDGDLKVTCPGVAAPISWQVADLRERWERALPEAMSHDASAS